MATSPAPCVIAAPSRLGCATSQPTTDSNLGDLSIVSFSDEGLLEYNRKYLDHDTYTDIITFDHSEGQTLSGDLLISLPRVFENAENQGVARSVELRRVMVHGLLHLAGFKDKTPDDAKGHARRRRPRIGHVPRGTTALNGFQPTFVSMIQTYDVIVVGAGHAGNEAAAAAANLGASTLLITMNMGVIGQMSCNPAMGGIAKGQIVREVDAMGGYSGLVSDRSAIQFRMLNKSKGPAMWSPRTQNDRNLFAQTWREMLEATPNLDFWQDSVVGILTENGRCVGVKTGLGMTVRAKAVVLTNGTFLNGLMHIGEKQFGGGRAGERASQGITEQLVELGFESGRMKTGTPPRVDGRSLDYSKMTEQPGDVNPGGSATSPTTPSPSRCLATSRTLLLRFTTCCEKVLIDHPCSTVASAAWGPVTAPASRTKSIASPTKTATRSLWSPKVGTPVRSM